MIRILPPEGDEPQHPASLERLMRNSIRITSTAGSFLLALCALPGCSQDEADKGKMEGGATDKGKMSGAMEPGKVEGGMDKGKMQDAGCTQVILMRIDPTKSLRNHR